MLQINTRWYIDFVLHLFLHGTDFFTAVWHISHCTLQQSELYQHEIMTLSILSLLRNWISIINDSSSRQMLYLLPSVELFSPSGWNIQNHIELQSSAVITRPNFVRYYIDNYRNRTRISIRCWIHKGHPIPHPNRPAMGCLLWIVVRK